MNREANERQRKEEEQKEEDERHSRPQLSGIISTDVCVCFSTQYTFYIFIGSDPIRGAPPLGKNRGKNRQKSNPILFTFCSTTQTITPTPKLSKLKLFVK